MSTIITNIKQLDLKGTYSYADYLLWQFSERVELIKGKVFKMSPAPSSSHQDISLNLTRIIDKVFIKTSCKFYVAPFDVRLVDYKQSTNENQILSVVQPDLCVICDRTKVDSKGCLGSPDLVVEILSAGNSKKEMDTKFDLYQENKILEYWIVDPMQKSILVYVYENNRYIGLKPYLIDSKIISPTFPDLKVSVKKVFEIK